MKQEYVTSISAGPRFAWIELLKIGRMIDRENL